MEVGERIRKRREQLGITQEELAKRVGYTSTSSVAKVEANANGMVQSKLLAFAKALQTTPSYLLGWEDEDQINTTKKNDILSDIILQATVDNELLELIQLLSQVPLEQREAVKSILSALIKTK